MEAFQLGEEGAPLPGCQSPPSQRGGSTQWQLLLRAAAPGSPSGPLTAFWDQAGPFGDSRIV